jgi:hypothetical protein
MDKALELKDKIDNLYNDVRNDVQGGISKLDKLFVEVLSLEDLSGYNEEEKQQIKELINSFIDKIKLIYEILEVKSDNLLTLEYLQEEFSKLEIKRFVIENNYVMGIIRIEDIDNFKQELFQFRDMLYAITISDSNLLEIAKMKSKIQHFNTEILEDEDILKQAYENSN